MNGHGGARPGAGGKKGNKIKRTQELVAQAAAEGITPLQYMLKILRDENEDPSRRDSMAHAAAPYLHPKLSSVESKVLVQSAEERLTKLKELLS